MVQEQSKLKLKRIAALQTDPVLQEHYNKVTSSLSDMILPTHIRVSTAKAEGDLMDILEDDGQLGLEDMPNMQSMERLNIIQSQKDIINRKVIKIETQQPVTLHQIANDIVNQGG